MPEHPGAGIADERGGETEVEVRRCFESCDRIGWKVEVRGAEVVEKLVESACADDWVDNVRSGPRPCDGYLSGRGSEFIGDGLHHCCHLVLLFGDR